MLHGQAVAIPFVCKGINKDKVPTYICEEPKLRSERVKLYVGELFKTTYIIASVKHEYY